MTGMLLALLALQAPLALEEGGSVELSSPEMPLLVPSATGRWLALHSAGEIQVLEAGSFKPVKRLAVAASALTFDAGDEALTVAGPALRRYDTKTWAAETLVELPDADSPAPGAALFLREGQLWYRNRDGWISTLRKDGEDFKRKTLDRPKDSPRELLRSFCADAGAAVLVTVAQEQAGGIVLDGRFHFLPSADLSVALAPTKNGAINVSAGSISIYVAPTWRTIWRDGVNRNLAAAVDPATNIAFVSRADGLWAFEATVPDRSWRLDAVKLPFSAMAVDSAGRRLYGITGQTVRCWTIKSAR